MGGEGVWGWKSGVLGVFGAFGVYSMCSLMCGVVLPSSLYDMKHGICRVCCRWLSDSFSVGVRVLLTLHSISMMLYGCCGLFVGLSAMKSGNPVVPLLYLVDLACIMVGGDVVRSIWLFHLATIYPWLVRCCLVLCSCA